MQTNLYWHCLFQLILFVLSLRWTVYAQTAIISSSFDQSYEQWGNFADGMFEAERTSIRLRSCCNSRTPIQKLGLQSPLQGQWKVSEAASETKSIWFLLPVCLFPLEWVTESSIPLIQDRLEKLNFILSAKTTKPIILTFLYLPIQGDALWLSLQHSPTIPAA